MSDKRMTFDDIIKAKRQRENDKLTVKPVVIPSVGKELIFRRPKDEQMLEFMDTIQKDSSNTVMIDEYAKILYLSCDELQNPDLHKELDVVDPFDTIKAFMDANDILRVGDAVCNMNSLYKGLENEVKN